MMQREDAALTIAAGGRKPEGLRLAVAGGAGTIILDDAFHRRDLARDLDLVVLDGLRGLGNGRCLPRGPLREPLESLARADGFVVTLSPGMEVPAALAEALGAVAAGRPLVTATKVPSGLRLNPAGPVAEFSSLAGVPVFAFCGLGNPASFRDTLTACAAKVLGLAAFPDHHRYSPPELAELARRVSAAGAAAAVTTTKDGVRIGSWPGPVPLLELRIGLALGGDVAWLDGRLDALVAQAHRGAA